MAAETDHFDVRRLHELFLACKNENGTICIDSYVNAYDEISKLLKMLGTVFGFVNSDVVEKVEILREYRKSEDSDNYKTIQMMLQYEVDNNTTNNKKKASGSRTLLRLHRALQFVADFLLAIQEADEHSKLSSVGSKSYYRTLSQHHPWIIRKGVDVAVLTLPTRKNFIEKLKIEDIAHTEDLMEKTAKLGLEIFDIVEDLYTRHDLHGLP